MRRLFHDKALEAEFREKGYVVVPFLDAEQVASLKERYFELLPQNMGHITPEEEGHLSGEELTYDFTFINRNIEYKRACFDEIVKVFTPLADGVLDHYKPIIANFIRKKTGDGEVPLHQNWAFADEKKCTTVTIWCPLVHSNRANGTLRIIPGSHKKFGEIRGPMVPWELHEIENEIVESDLWDYMEIPSGKAVILDDGVIHYSAPNTTDGLRLAIQLIMIPEEFPSIHYHLDPDKDTNLIEVLEVDREFYMTFNPWKKPPRDIRIVDSFYYNPVSLNFDQFIKRLGEAPYDRQGDHYRFEEYTGEGIRLEPLFRNGELQAEFEQNGFVKIQALDKVAVETLKEFYFQQGLNDDKGYGFHISMDHNDKARVGAIMEKIFTTALPQVSAHFNNARAFICSYVIKEPNPLGIVPSHQDWTFVDNEEKHCSVTVWIPLVDVTLENGALGAIKGSHNFARNYRPSPSPGVKNPLDPYMFRIFPYHEILEMNAGEAFVFNNRTFHASPPNTSPETRLAVGIGFTQKDAKLVHYYLDPINREHVHKYEVDEAFFRKYDNATLTDLFNQGKLIEDYKVLAVLPYRPLRFEPDRLLEQIIRHNNSYNVELTERLAQLFSHNPDGTQRDGELKGEPRSIPGNNEERPAAATGKRPLWKIYTPGNIYREMKHRLAHKP